MKTTDRAAAGARARVLGPDEGESLNVVGDTIRVLVSAEDSGGRCSIFEVTTPPGCGPPLHRHGAEDEFFSVVEGRYEFVMDGKSVLVGPGAFVSAPRGSVHAFCNVGLVPGRLFVTCTPGGIERAFRETHEASKRGAPTPEQLGRIFESADLTFHGPPLRPR